MSLHFAADGVPLADRFPAHGPSPSRILRQPRVQPLATSLLSPTSATSTQPSPSRSPQHLSPLPASVSKPSPHGRLLLSPGREAASAEEQTHAPPHTLPALSKHSSMPLKSPSPIQQMQDKAQQQALSVQESLDESLQLLARLGDQLRTNSSRDISGDLSNLTKLLTSARSHCVVSSASDFHRSMQRDLRRRARGTTVREESDVLKWLSSAYSQPGTALDEGNEEMISVPRTHRSKQSSAHEVHHMASALLTLRFIRKIRASITRRVLRASCWTAVGALEVSDPLKAVLSTANDWDRFDVFELERVAGAYTLVVLAFHLFSTRLDLLTRFKVNPAHFANFFEALEAGYKNVPYHSHTHAADVLQNTFFLLTAPSMHPDASAAGGGGGRITFLDLFSGLIAAACHDYAHPGTNNAFQTATQSDLALRYNDRAPLENMHVSETFLLMRRPHHDILSGLTPAERAECRSTIVASVLATDMSTHFKNLAELKAQLASSPPSVAGSWQSTPAHRLLCVETALHVSDLGNPAKPLPIYLEWTKRVMEEFYKQGTRAGVQGND